MQFSAYFPVMKAFSLVSTMARRVDSSFLHQPTGTHGVSIRTSIFIRYLYETDAKPSRFKEGRVSVISLTNAP